MDYISLIIVLVGGLVAVRGNTWSNEGITKWGYITASIAVFGFTIAIYQTYITNISSSENTKLLLLAKENSKKAADTISNMESKIDIYQNIIDDIKKYSERQEQIVMIQAVNIPPNGTWKAPNKIYSGSKVEAYFHKGNSLEIQYLGKKQSLKRGTDNWAKLFVIGKSGEEFPWIIHNLSSSTFEGKIEVLSTPRSRSKDWSWMEEKLNKTDKNG